MALQVTSSAPVGSRDGQVYWTGQDGNIWLRGADGQTSNLGSPMQAQVWNLGLNGAQEIADPNPGNGQVQGTQIDLSGGGGGGGAAAPTYKDTTGARGATQVSINSLDTILGNAKTGADAEWKSVTDAYGAEDAENLTKYQGDVEKNEINRDKSTQASLVGAARGGRGLYATLASLGALGGTGRMLANRAVATEANADLGEGEQNFETNTGSLFDARSALEKQERQRRLDADKIRTDAKQNAEYDYYKGNQDLAKEMAGLWSDAGNFGEANNWMTRSSTYTPEIASRTKVNPGQYAKTPLAYSAPALKNYLGGQKSTAVNVAAGGPATNGAVYASTRERDEI